MDFSVGNRVYYRENGPDDIGTVVKVDDDGTWVEFDRDKPFSYPETDAYEVDQLAMIEG